MPDRDVILIVGEVIEMSKKFRFVYPNSNVQPLGNVSAEVMPLRLTNGDFDEDGKVKESVIADYYEKNKEELNNYWKEEWSCNDPHPTYEIDWDEGTLRRTSVIITKCLLYWIIIEEED